MNTVFSGQQALCVDENTVEALHNRAEMKQPCLPSLNG